MLPLTTVNLKGNSALKFLFEDSFPSDLKKKKNWGKGVTSRGKGGNFWEEGQHM